MGVCERFGTCLGQTFLFYLFPLEKWDPILRNEVELEETFTKEIEPSIHDDRGSPVQDESSEPNKEGNNVWLEETLKLRNANKREYATLEVEMLNVKKPEWLLRLERQRDLEWEQERKESQSISITSSQSESESISMSKAEGSQTPVKNMWWDFSDDEIGTITREESLRKEKEGARSYFNPTGKAYSFRDSDFCSWDKYLEPLREIVTRRQPTDLSVKDEYAINEEYRPKELTPTHVGDPDYRSKELRFSSFQEFLGKIHNIKSGRISKKKRKKNRASNKREQA